MVIIVFLIILLVMLLLAPIGVATWYYKTKKGEILHINQQKVRDPRYFGKSFAGLVRKNKESIVGNHIKLSRKEEFLDKAGARESGEKVTKLVLTFDKDFWASEKNKVFEKEIFSEGNVSFIHPKVTMRAAYSGNQMVLGNEIEVVRWVDAEKTLAVYDNCDLGISATAGEQLCIGAGCKFQRLFAPIIKIGQRPDSKINPEDGKNPEIFRMSVKREREIVHGSHIGVDDADENGIVAYTVISRSGITIVEDIIIQGDVRSHRGVRLCDGAVVCGNIFAEGDIRLGRNCVVLGSIFTQSNVYLEEGAVVGQKGKISSVIARENIIFEKNNFVFGYVSCERRGHTEEQEEQTTEFVFLDVPSYREELCFKDIKEYEALRSQNFRKEKELKKVIIPDEVIQIEESMFFDCRNLKFVRLPKTVERIESYAFADCYALEEVQGFEKMWLKILKTSAFENCRSLTNITLPASVTEIHGAAFGGCEKLKKFEMPENSCLKFVGDHCFCGCKRLREIYLPDSVTYVGVSAFKDCEVLKRISLPESCREQKGIQELFGTDVELLFRICEGGNE